MLHLTTILQLLQQSLPILAIVCFGLGLLVGSFLNVVVYRLPLMLQRDWKRQCCQFLEIEDAKLAESESPVPNSKKLSLAKPASHCPKCQHQIRPWENIPLVSYVLLAGKCAGCKARISIRYPILELASGLLSSLVAVNFGATWLTLALLFFAWALIALTMIDFDHQLLPDNITLPLLWLGLAVNTQELGTGVTTQESILGAVVGYLSLWSFYWIFKLLTGKEGMGYGDFKLLAALGAWMGWQAVLPIIFLSSLIGAAFGFGSIVLMGRNRSAPMPFGPFLNGAGLIMMIWGNQIYNFYGGLFLI